MSARFNRAALAAICSLLFVPCAAFTAEPPKTDLFGDPLPDGAIARMGTCRFRPGGAISDCAFSPDGKILATSGDCVCFWDAASGKLIRRDGAAQTTAPNAHFEPSEWHIQFTENGKRYLLRNPDGISLCDASSGRCLRSFSGLGEIRAVSSDGKRLAARNGEILTIWGLDHEEPEKLGTVYGGTSAAGFSADGATVLAIDDHRIRCLGLDGREVRPGIACTLFIRYMDVSSNRRNTTVVLSGRRYLEVRDITAPQSSWRIDMDVTDSGAMGPTFCKFSPDGGKLMVGLYSGRVVVWNVLTRRQIFSWNYQYYSNEAGCWSADSKRIAICSAGAVHIRNAETGEEQPSFSVPESRFPSIHFLQRGKDTLVADGNCDPPSIWDPRSGKVVRGFSEKAFSFSRVNRPNAVGPVGKSQLFASRTGRFVLFDCVSGRTRELAALDEEEKERRWEPVVSPDGSMMIVHVTTLHGHRDRASRFLTQVDLRQEHWEVWRSPWERPVPMKLPASVSIRAILPDNEHALGSVTEGDFPGGKTTILLWSINDYDHALTLCERPFANPIALNPQDFAVSPDGKYAAFNLSNSLETVLLDLAAKTTCHTWQKTGNRASVSLGWWAAGGESGHGEEQGEAKKRPVVGITAETHAATAAFNVDFRHLSNVGPGTQP